LNTEVSHKANSLAMGARGRFNVQSFGGNIGPSALKDRVD